MVSVALVLALALAQSLASLYLPRLMADIVDDGIVPGDTRQIMIYGALMLLMALVGTACAVASSYFSSKIATGFRPRRAQPICSIAWRISPCISSISFSTASLITRTTNDTTQVQQVLIMMLTMVITAPMMAIGGVVLSLSQDTRLARVLIAVIPIMAIVFFLIMRQAIPLFQQMQVKIDRLNLVLDEGLTGVRVIRAFDRNTHESRRFDAANRDLTDNAIAVNRLVVDADAGDVPDDEPHERRDHLVRRAPHRRRTDAGRRDDGVAAVRDADPVLGVHGHGDVRDAAARGGVGGAHQRGARRRCRTSTTPRSAGHGAGRRPASDRRGRVEFQNVTFQYPGAEEPALSGVSFIAHGPAR